MGWIAKNNYLTMNEMSNNAELVYAYLSQKGWTKNAICGLLGNMQTESNINPGLWESLRPFGNPTAHGYGLVQWTPYTNITNWLESHGYNIDDGNGQLEKILEEVHDGSQWIKTSQYPMSFEEFTKSTLSPNYLALVFIKNYERPYNANQPIRGTQADYWYEHIKGDGTITPSPPTDGGGNIESGHVKLKRQFWYDMFTPISGKNEYDLITQHGNVLRIKSTTNKREYLVLKSNIIKI